MFLKKTNQLKIIILISFATLLASPAFADVVGLTNKPLATIINNITIWLLGIVTLIAVLFIIIGGVYYMTSAGDERRIETAKSIITYAILGLFVAAIAYAAVLLVNKLVGA